MGKRKRRHLAKMVQRRNEDSLKVEPATENSLNQAKLVSKNITPKKETVRLEEPMFITEVAEVAEVEIKKTPTKKTRIKKPSPKKTTARKTTTRRRKINSSK